MEQKIKSGWHFLRVIGEGAFSRVYLTEDGKGRRAACKVSGELKMLEREAEMLSRLYHPLFPAYMGYEEWDDAAGLWMEYIHGRSLGQMMQFRGKFSVRQTMRFAEELADGLRYLHERQPSILYRDLKPENVMVCQDGHIKLVDLGCACYQDDQRGTRAGTPGFAPPEQLVKGGFAGLYSDVYSLGRLLQNVMTEKGGERKSRIQLRHTIEECTREDPRQRPQDMISVAFLLTGKREKAQEIICEKNIWESSYKNSCSLSSI